MTTHRRTLHTIFKRFQKANPAPQTELQYQSPFELLIAVMLSAQATDASVNRATPQLFAQANTPADMLKLGVDGIRESIKTIGLYNSKAQNIYLTCQKLCEKAYPKVIPETMTDLVALPGVGRKTANVVLNAAFGLPTMPVDTHVFRVAHRLQWSDGKTPDAVEQDLLQCIPEQYMQHAHHWLILHGRYTCQARKPRCGDCLIADLCPHLRAASEDNKHARR